MSQSVKTGLKIGILLVALIGIGTWVFLNRGTSESALEKDTIIVGMELKFPPFETVDNAGKPMGVSVELANRLGEKLGKKVEIKSVDYPSLIPALQSQSIDMIISSMTITEERLQSIDFSNDYARSDLALAVGKDLAVQSYQDLNDAKYTIAVKQGTIGEMWAKTNLPNAKIKEFSEVAAGMLDVNNGQSAAFIYDPLSLIEGSQNLSNIRVIVDPLPGVKGWGIGMRKGDEDLKAAVNKALEEIKDEGFFEEMRTKYLKEEVEKYQSYGLQYFF